MTNIRNADKYKIKIPQERMFGYADKSRRFLETSGVTRAASQAENPDLVVREKARDRTEGRVSPDCRCLRLGSSLGCGRARLCSLQTHTGSCRISPRPPAPL